MGSFSPWRTTGGFVLGKSDTPPDEWFKNKEAAYLDRHLIPHDPALWKLDRFEGKAEGKAGSERRVRAFTSDIAGQDIHAHGGSPERAIAEVRDWLVAASGRRRLPGGAEIVQQYKVFLKGLPGLCARFRRQQDALTFVDLAEMIEIW